MQSLPYAIPMFFYSCIFIFVQSKRPLSGRLVQPASQVRSATSRCQSPYRYASVIWRVTGGRRISHGPWDARPVGIIGSSVTALPYYTMYS